jgi:hypothetical protein
MHMHPPHPHMGVPNAMGAPMVPMPMAPGSMVPGGMIGAPLPYDTRRDRDDGEFSAYDTAPRGSGSGSRGHGGAQKRPERDGRDGRGKRDGGDRRQAYYHAQQGGGAAGGVSGSGDGGLSAGLGAMSLGTNSLTQNLTQTSNGPLTQASSTLSQPMSQPDRVSLSALSQESYQGDDFYKSQSFVDPYM